MATTHLQIPDIQANQNQKEVTANAAHDLLDKALNANDQKTIVGSTSFTTTETRENFVIELVGTPGGAFNLDMPDTNKRTLAVVNNTDSQATIRNSAAGGTGQPVIEVGEASIFHYDGTNFFDLSALALAVASWLGLTDTPSSFSGQSGQVPTVNSAETALEFIKTSMKLPVRVATTVAGTLSTDFENLDTVDGVTLATGDRILIKDQAAGAENGIYIVQASGAPVRADDFDDDVDVEGGVAVTVQEGTSNADTFWIVTNDGAITVGTTALVFAQLLSPGTFLSLTDSPSAYTNESGKTVRVNSAENALEFVPEEWKLPVRVATTVDGALATAYENGDTVDGVTLSTGDRILLKDQSTGSENGIYVVNATGAPTRAIDFDDDADAVRGAIVAVLEGDTQAQTTWMHTTSGAITLGSTALTFAKMQPVIGKLDLSLGTLREIVTNDIPNTAGDAGVLSSDTSPSYARVNGATDKALRVNWPATNSDEVQFPPTFMPPDIDETKDLTIHLVARMSGATDTPTIDVQVFDGIGDTEMGGATAALSNTLAELTVTIAAADIAGHPTGFLNIALIPGAHTTDAVELYAAWIEYTRKTA